MEVWDEEDPRYRGIKLSSAGLIYKHYGREVITNAVKENWGQELSKDILDKVHSNLYNKLIVEVDANDNGIAEADRMRFKSRTGLADRIARYNPRWGDAPDKCQHA